MGQFYVAEVLIYHRPTSEYIPAGEKVDLDHLSEEAQQMLVDRNIVSLHFDRSLDPLPEPEELEEDSNGSTDS